MWAVIRRHDRIALCDYPGVRLFMLHVESDDTRRASLGIHYQEQGVMYIIDLVGIFGCLHTPFPLRVHRSHIGIPVENGTSLSKLLPKVILEMISQGIELHLIPEIIDDKVRGFFAYGEIHEMIPAVDLIQLFLFLHGEGNEILFVGVATEYLCMDHLLRRIIQIDINLPVPDEAAQQPLLADT